MSVRQQLKRLLRVKYLHDDAKRDVRFMLQLHEAGEFNLARYSPTVLIYPILVNQESPAGLVLRACLQGFAGDLFQTLADTEYEGVDECYTREPRTPYCLTDGSNRVFHCFLAMTWYSLAVIYISKEITLFCQI